MGEQISGGKSIAGRGSSGSKGLEVGPSLVCLMSSEDSRGQVLGERRGEGQGLRSQGDGAGSKGLAGHCRDFGFCCVCLGCHQRVQSRGAWSEVGSHSVAPSPELRRCWKHGDRQEAIAVIPAGDGGGRGPGGNGGSDEKD